MKVTIETIKIFAWNQMDAMWHDGSGLATTDMVKFTHKGWVVVNPWMDEKTEKEVDPYQYYGKRKTDNFISEASKRIQASEINISLRE